MVPDLADVVRVPVFDVNGTRLQFQSNVSVYSEGTLSNRYNKLERHTLSRLTVWSECV